MLAIEYHVYIWQVSPQLSCGDTFQIWMWFRESYRYFSKIENFACGEISEQSFSNPHPWPFVSWPPHGFPSQRVSIPMSWCQLVHTCHHRIIKVFSSRVQVDHMDCPSQGFTMLHHCTAVCGLQQNKKECRRHFTTSWVLCTASTSQSALYNIDCVR